VAFSPDDKLLASASYEGAALQTLENFSWFGSLGEDGDEAAICTAPDNEAALAGVEGLQYTQAEPFFLGLSDEEGVSCTFGAAHLLH
jgi:hypothetical protein